MCVIRSGFPSHADSTYYAPIADRSNLDSVTEVVVDKLMLQKTGNGPLVAKGVFFSSPKNKGKCPPGAKGQYPEYSRFRRKSGGIMKAEWSLA